MRSLTICKHLFTCRIEAITAIKELDSICFRCSFECILYLSYAKLIHANNVQVRSSYIFCKHVGLLRSLLAALLSERTGQFLQCSITGRFEIDIELTSIECHTLNINCLNALHIIEIAMQQFHNLIRRLTCCTRSINATTHKSRVGLAYAGISSCKLIEANSNFILRLFLSLGARNINGRPNVQSLSITLAIVGILKAKISQTLWLTKHIRQIGTDLRPLRFHAKLCRIIDSIYESQLCLNVFSSRFQNALSCKTSKPATNGASKASAKCNVPGKVSSSSTIEDGTIIHRGSNGQLLSSANQCLICHLPAELFAAGSRL